MQMQWQTDRALFRVRLRRVTVAGLSGGVALFVFAFVLTKKWHWEILLSAAGVMFVFAPLLAWLVSPAPESDDHPDGGGRPSRRFVDNFTLRSAVAAVFGAIIAYAIIWTYRGELKLGDLAVFIVAGLFMHFAAWVFKNVEREPTDANPPQSGSNVPHILKMADEIDVGAAPSGCPNRH